MNVGGDFWGGGVIGCVGACRLCPLGGTRAKALHNTPVRHPSAEQVTLGCSNATQRGLDLYLFVEVALNSEDMRTLARMRDCCPSSDRAWDCADHMANTPSRTSHQGQVGRPTVEEWL